MSKFPQPLYYKAGYKYQVDQDFALDLREHITGITGYDVHTRFLTLQGGFLTIKAGYAWDGPSGPTYDTSDGVYGSLPHDAGYQLIRLGLVPAETRREWDVLFREMLIDGGMEKARADVWFAGVRVGAGFAIKPDAEPKVLTAP